MIASLHHHHQSIRKRDHHNLILFDCLFQITTTTTTTKVQCRKRIRSTAGRIRTHINTQTNNVCSEHYSIDQLISRQQESIRWQEHNS